MWGRGREGWGLWGRGGVLQGFGQRGRRGVAFCRALFPPGWEALGAAGVSLQKYLPRPCL